MTLIELIKELQKIQVEHGDLDVYMAGEVGGSIGKQANTVVEDVCFEIIPETNKRYYRSQISSGCRCMSCWDEVLIDKKSLLIY